MLAIAQLARTPRQPLRMILLLALATAFAIFTLIFAASQSQHIVSIASYESGADFSGDIPVTSQYLNVQHATSLYDHIPGVISTTVGYTGSGSASGTSETAPIEIRAVDASTFAHTAIWNSQDSRQPLDSLMTELINDRQNALVGDQVPTIIDALTMSRLGLQSGDSFTLSVDGLQNNT
jgi:hypothetical protein